MTYVETMLTKSFSILTARNPEGISNAFANDAWNAPRGSQIYSAAPICDHAGNDSHGGRRRKHPRRIRVTLCNFNMNDLHGQRETQPGRNRDPRQGWVVERQSNNVTSHCTE